MRELVTHRIQTHATKLKLLHLAKAVDLVVTRTQEGQLGYREFLDLVLEEEIGVREGRRFKQALKLAGLPHHKSLDSFEFAFQPDLDGVRVKEAGHPPVRGAEGQCHLPGAARDGEDASRRGPGHRGLPAGVLHLLHHSG